MKKTKFIYALFSTLLGMHKVGGDPLVSVLTIKSWLRNLVNYYKAFVNLTLRRLMSCIYGAPILDVSRSHKTTQHSR